MKRMAFDTESVLAFPRKTETTRVVKPQPCRVWSFNDPSELWTWEKAETLPLSDSDLRAALVKHACYHVGDLVAVTEWFSPYADEETKHYCQTTDPYWGATVKPCVYKADYLPGSPLEVGGCERWLPPFLMKVVDSRITIEITSVTAGRVQDLTYEQILAEGWDPRTSQPMTTGTAGEDARLWWQRRWDGVCPEFPHNTNSWARRYGFKVLEVK